MDRNLGHSLTPALILCLAMAPSSIRSSNANNNEEYGALTLQADRIFQNTNIINFFSVFTKEPDDGADQHRIPDTQQLGYHFPIQRIKRHQDPKGVITLNGIIYVRGDANVVAIPQINQFFADAGGQTRLGTQ